MRHTESLVVTASLKARMLDTEEKSERRTAADAVFDRLYEDIVSLKLLPGTKLSEAEVARQFGLSRQPVRDAFTRLGSTDLLLIRPQRATEVRGFSIERINHSRFVRLAIELEVVNDACKLWNDQKAQTLQKHLDRQANAIETNQPEQFHALDLSFHELLSTLSEHPKAAQNIRDCKQELDRLCILSLGRANEANTLYNDHSELANAINDRDVNAAVEVTRLHLSRLDSHIETIHSEHREYFEAS